MTSRLAIFDTHPIQYFAPQWRHLAATPELEIVIYYFSDHSVRGGIDPGFGVPVAWDTPITEGYEHQFITREADFSRPRTVSIPNVNQLLREGRFDAVLVHGYQYRFCRQALRAARGLKIGTILRGEFNDRTPYGGRNPFKTTVRNLYLRWLYDYVDAFCYIGEEARHHLLRRGIPTDRMFFSPYAVDTELFHHQKEVFTRSAARAELKIADEQFVIVFSGKLIPRKAPDLIVQALAELPDVSGITLLLLGEGPMHAELEKAGQKVLGNRLQISGFVNQSQLGKYYAAADISILPSHFETWGLVVNEAMQFGLPVIVSHRVGCRRDLLVEGETGLTFHSGDADDLARCIAKLFGDRNLVQQMGRKAAVRVEKYSTKNAVAGILQAVRAVDSKVRA